MNETSDTPKLRYQNGDRRAARYRVTPDGMTLVEVMVSLVLISTILLVSLTASANLRMNDRERLQIQDASSLASCFLDEISALPFRDPAGGGFGLEEDESAGDRTTFDDVDDYHAYSESPPTHRSGSTIESYAGWGMRIEILPATPTEEGLETIDDVEAPLRLIVAHCRDPDGKVTRTAMIVSRIGGNLVPGESHQLWRRIKLEFPERTVDVCVPLRNQPLN